MLCVWFSLWELNVELSKLPRTVYLFLLIYFAIEYGATSNHMFMYQVTRIMDSEIDSPYDVLGVNHNMSDGNIKKKYAFLYLFL